MLYCSCVIEKKAGCDFPIIRCPLVYKGGWLFRRYHLQIVFHMKLSVLKSTFSYIHCLCLLKFCPSPVFATTGLLWLLLTSRHSLLLTDFIHGLLVRLFQSADEISLGTTHFFLSIYLPHLLQLIPSSYWTLVCMATLSLTVAWCDFCSSDQRFAATFLQIRGRPRHPWSWLYPSHY